MIGIVSRPDIEQKLQILSEDARFDLACACGSDSTAARRRSGDGKWIYPVVLPSGGRTILLKTLLSNVCTNDCCYCPLREQKDIRRCTISPQQIAGLFIDYVRKGRVFGLFLSSAVCGSADNTMGKLNETAAILRKQYGFRGYIHLKIIPGASPAAIEQALSLASAISLNIETPGAENMAKLSRRKRYIPDIIEPMKLISRLTRSGARYAGVKQTTQFIVGPAGESDEQIVRYTAGLYQRLRLQRVYFSAYQNAPADELPPAAPAQDPHDRLTREHRLYQVDFLLRRYGFKDTEIAFDENGRLFLDADPKQIWAKNHPERFPVNINTADRWELLRVPGFGPLTVRKILETRKTARINGIEDLGRVGSRLHKAAEYLEF